MRILAALGADALAPGHEGAREAGLAQAASPLAALAAEHELAIFHSLGTRRGRDLELALRNALPGRDLATVLLDVVVDPAEAAQDGAAPPSAPRAIVELRGLRALIESGALAIAAAGEGAAVAVAEDGTMRRVGSSADPDLTAALLARRLDADLFLVLLAEGATPRLEAACSFAGATGRRAAVGELTRAAETARGRAGAQISPRCA